MVGTRLKHLPQPSNLAYGMSFSEVVEDPTSRIIYMVDVYSYDPVKEMIKWCSSTFSPRYDGHHDKARWFAVGGTFCFYDEADRTAFALRWA